MVVPIRGKFGIFGNHLIGGKDFFVHFQNTNAGSDVIRWYKRVSQFFVTFIYLVTFLYVGKNDDCCDG